MVSTQQSLKDHGEVFLENKIYHCREALRANGSADGKPLSSSISQGERGEQSEVLADRMCIYQTQPAGESYITSIPVFCLGLRHPPEHCFGLLWPNASRQGSVRLTSWWERQVLGARLLGIWDPFLLLSQNTHDGRLRRSRLSPTVLQAGGPASQQGIC